MNRRLSRTARTTACLTALAWLCACSDSQQTAPGDTQESAAATPEAAQTPAVAPVMNDEPIDGSRDYHSYANPASVFVSHIDLDLTVDFATTTLSGSATLSLTRASDDATNVVLDTRDLAIQGVFAGDEALDYALGTADPDLGAPLTIALPADWESPMSVRIDYATSPEASGLQWLLPAQTAGKVKPFLFTQSQAIHARSWIPLQDTPAVRVTYKATVRTPPDLLAVMSASNEPDTERDGVYEFAMPQPIPAYLIALGVGDLQFQAMSARTGVYAEPSLLAAAAAEFADTEEMLEISEGLFGPYRWGRYDLLILPPSFPFGGMENPRLSFITPTVIAGDKSLVSLIAHELAHSWSGNLVTNATWRDLWLNEGFTSYLTARIMEAVYGERRRLMEAVLDYQSLRMDLETLPPGDQVLAIDLRGRDPDDVFSDVPYVKGQMFIEWLEAQMGRAWLDGFLRRYFDEFAFKSITTDQFLAYAHRELVSASGGGVSQAAIDAWVHEPGLPADAVIPESDAFEKVGAQSAAWWSGDVAASALETADWTVHEWLYFLNNLPDKVDEARLVELDEAFALTASTNNEIAHSWLLIAIHNNYQPAFGRLESYLVEIGRRKLIGPLYFELMKTPEGAEFARRVYERARPGYHPLAQSSIDDIVGG